MVPLAEVEREGRVELHLLVGARQAKRGARASALDGARDEPEWAYRQPEQRILPAEDTEAQVERRDAALLHGRAGIVVDAPEAAVEIDRSGVEAKVAGLDPVLRALIAGRRLTVAAGLPYDTRERQRRVVRHREVAEEPVRGRLDDPELAHAASIDAEQGVCLREVEETFLPAPELGADALEVYRPERPTAARAGAYPLVVVVLAGRAAHRLPTCLGGGRSAGPLSHSGPPAHRAPRPSAYFGVYGSECAACTCQFCA